MKRSSTTIARQYCLECGAEVSPRADCCWCCRRALGKGAVSGNRLIAQRSADDYAEMTQRRVARYFGIAATLLIATVAEVIFFGIFVKEPGLGVALAILLTPALARMIVIAVQRRIQEKPISVSHRILIIFVWLLLGMVILVAAGITFVLTCKMPTNFH
jgi:hypothetical protein